MAEALLPDIQIQISGPTMAAALSLCTKENINRYALWFGDEVTTRTSIITDDNDDTVKEEKVIVLQSVQRVGLNALKSGQLILPKKNKIVGLIRLRDISKTIFECDQPMVMDRKYLRMIRDIENSDDLLPSKNLVFTLLTKDCRSTTVQNYFISGGLTAPKYEPKIIKVINLADGDSKIAQPATGSIAEWIPEPNVPEDDLIEFVFSEQRKQLERMAEKLAEKKATKAELAKEIQKLKNQLEMIKERNNRRSDNDQRLSSSPLYLGTVARDDVEHEYREPVEDNAQDTPNDQKKVMGKSPQSSTKETEQSESPQSESQKSSSSFSRSSNQNSGKGTKQSPSTRSESPVALSQTFSSSISPLSTNNRQNGSIVSTKSSQESLFTVSTFNHGYRNSHEKRFSQGLASIAGVTSKIKSQSSSDLFADDTSEVESDDENSSQDSEAKFEHESDAKSPTI